MRIRRTFPQLPITWFILLMILLPSLGISQTWRDTLQYANVTGVGVSVDGVNGDVPGNAIVEQQIRLHLQNENSRRGEKVARAVATTFVVTTINDTGSGSLRKAILDANANPGLDIISFNIPPAGLKTITPRTKLPNIVDPVIIDGTTQPGFVDKPIIQLYFASIGPYDGLDLYAGNSTVRGLVINGLTGGSGIVLWTNGNNVIEGNFIGVSLPGTYLIGNVWNGVLAKSMHNRIGGTTPASRNIFSGNGYPSVAFVAGAGGDRVVGNYFGTDFTGTSILGNLEEGVLIDYGSSNDTIGGTTPEERNIISGSYAPYSGITIAGHAVGSTRANLIIGNFIGTDVTGRLDFGNGGNGIHVLNSSDNVIGGTTKGERNIISGNELPGVSIHFAFSTGNKVQGNFIGTDSTGRLPVGNRQAGILIDVAADNLIGGTATGEANVISGNIGYGVVIRDTASHGNRVEGNFIGTMQDGVTILPNGSKGVWITGAPRNTIGGSDPAAGNLIGGNVGHGISITGDASKGNKIQHNLIGTDASATKNLGNGGSGVSIEGGSENLIEKNRISSNTGLGIDLFPAWVTPNDSLDEDDGPNRLLNFPILDLATIAPGSIRIRGRYRGQPSMRLTIDFFRNDVRNPSHFGEGQTWIGDASILCDASGRADINVTLSAFVAPDQFITATATDPVGNTSEFSRALCLADLDGDGILDCWESEGDGIDVNADGVIDLDLYAKGARPDHKDIFVEVDYMFGADVRDRTLPMVEAAFARVKNKYVHNPDGNDGINLFAELNPYDLPITSAAWAYPPWPQFFEAKKQFFGTDAERSDPNAENILEAKRLVYRYCIFADRFVGSGASGKGEDNYGAGGNDFMVTLGTFSPVTDELQAGTFMHELGHTLGLQHGGGDTVLYKPNYISVMNYVWQAPQFTQQHGGFGWRLDYSPVALPSLDENHLYEPAGLEPVHPPPSDFETAVVPFNGPANVRNVAILYPGRAVDWDGDGVTTGWAQSPVNINWLDKTDPPDPGQLLSSYADWPNLVYNFRNSPTYRDPSSTEPRTMAVGTSAPEEMTPEIYDSLKALPPYGIMTPLNSWPSDPGGNIPIATASNGQGLPVIATDARGGAIIAYSWNTTAKSGMDIYAQRVDSLGGVQWRNNGVPICTANGVQEVTSITPDGYGGAIIVWQDKRNGRYEIYAQRINEFGQTWWQRDGIQLDASVHEGYQPVPVVAPVLGGGACVAWRDGHSGKYSVYAQQISPDGFLQWPAAAILVSANVAPLQDSVIQMTTGDSNSVIITWVYQSTGFSNQYHDIYAQKLDVNGALRWGPDGVPLCTAPNEQNWPRIRRDGSGGAIISWHDQRYLKDDIYVQRVNADGQIQWAADGVPISVNTGGKIYPEIAVDGTGGAIVAWMDSRRMGSAFDVYAQRVNGSGTIMWQDDGVAVCETTMCGLHPTLVTDFKGGAVISFSNKRGASMDIYAQHVDSSGARLWTNNGVPVCTADNDQLFPVCTSDRAGGAILTWYDNRSDSTSNTPHIYAQKVTGSGGLGQDIITAVNDRHTVALPTSFSLSQNYPNPFNPTTTIRYGLPKASHVTLKVYNLLGQVVTVLIDETQEAGVKSVRWNASRFASGMYFYRLKADNFIETKKLLLVK